MLRDHPSRAVLYARVSTQSQVTEGTSLQSQRERLRTAAVRRGITVVDEISDDGVSGSLHSRPGLDRALDLVDSGQVDCFLVTKIDRVSRSLGGFVRLLDQLKGAGVTLIALDDDIDMSTPAGRAVAHILAVFAEFERDMIRSRTTEGSERRAAEGGWMGGPAPYGYRSVAAPDGRGKVLTIDDDEANVVRLACQLLMDGATTGEVAAKLNVLGPAPRRAHRWTHHGLRSLLVENTGLSGSRAWRRAGRRGRTTADEVTSAVPAILTVAEHEQMLAVLAETTSQPTKRRAYMLTGHLYGPCGQRYQGIPGKADDVWHYRCAGSSASRRDGLPRCDCHRLHGPMIEAAVWGHVVDTLGDPAARGGLAVESVRGRSGGSDAERLAALDRSIATAEERISSESAAMRAEDISEDVMAVAVRRLAEEIDRLGNEHKEIVDRQRRVAAAGTVGRRLRQEMDRLGSCLADGDDTMRRRVIAALSVRVDVQGWDVCGTCDGAGLVPRSEIDRQRGRGTGTMCPTCRRTTRTVRYAFTAELAEVLSTAVDAGIKVAKLPPQPSAGQTNDGCPSETA